MDKRTIVPTKVQEIRKKRKMTINQLSNITGISVSSIKKIEAQSCNPLVNNLIKIAKALKSSPNELLMF